MRDEFSKFGKEEFNFVKGNLYDSITIGPSNINRMTYCVSCYTQGQIWFLVCWKYDPVWDDGAGNIREDYVKEFATYINCEDFDDFKKMIEKRKVYKNKESNFYKKHRESITDINRFIFESEGEYFIEYVFVKEGNVVTDYILSTGSPNYRVSKIYDVVTKIYYTNHLESYKFNISDVWKVGGVVYNWRDKVVIDQFKYIENMVGMSIPYNSNTTLEYIYSYLVEKFDSEKKVSEMLNMSKV